MDKNEVLELVCDEVFQTLVRKNKSIKGYLLICNKQSIEEAIQIIKFLDHQQTFFNSNDIQQKYNAVLHKILFDA